MALVILGIGVLGLSASAALVSRLIGDGSRLTLAATIATARFEQLRTLSCATVEPGAVVTRGIEERWTVAPMGESALEVQLSVTYPLRTAADRRPRRQLFRGAIPCR